MKKTDRIIKEYTQVLTITEEEYQTAQKELTPAEFEHRYLIYKEYGKIVYKTRVIPSLEEVGNILAYETLKNVRTIKGCVVFFTVLTAAILVFYIVRL